MSAILGVIAGLALIATFAFPLMGGTRGLVKALAVAASLAVLAAVLITAARAFGP